MKIALIGYGKMGKAIERLALQRGHEIVLKIDRDNANVLSNGELNRADVAIEFTQPENAKANILFCFNHKLPVVVGTTGWYQDWEEVKNTCQAQKGALIAATNFSIGVNLFFELNKKLAALMRKHKDYQAEIEEIHHIEKLDSPSGTAITLAEGLIENHPQYSAWVNEKSENATELEIRSLREPGVPGTHTIRYQSDIDDINITHTAKSRDGFALGAVIAAEYLVGKTGIYSMKDVLNF